MPFYFIRGQEIGPVFAADPTPEREAQLLASGYTKVEDSKIYSREDYIYIDGAFAPRPEPSAAEQLAQASSDKRLELARQASSFVAALGDDELALIQAVDPSRTSERYPDYWVQWASGQHMMAEQIAASASATQDQIDRANAVIAAYRSVLIWIGKISAGPLAAAYAELAAAVVDADLAAVEAIDLDLDSYKIGATGAEALPDPDITRVDLALLAADLALLDT